MTKLMKTQGSNPPLQSLTTANLSNEAFPFGTARTIELGMSLVRAHRITYVGELGWELYIPTEFARQIFDLVVESARSHRLRFVGVHAMNSLRLEKAYRDFGHDISDEDHVLEAGLGFAVKPDKARGKLGDFLGREAVLRKKQTGLSKRLLQFQLSDPEPLVYDAEPILRNGAFAGYLSSGGYGHFLGASIGLGYFACEPDEKLDDLLCSRYEIEVSGKLFTASVSSKPFYDPTSARIRT